MPLKLPSPPIRHLARQLPFSLSRTSRRTIFDFRKPRLEQKGPAETLNVERLSRRRKEYNQHRLAFLVGGALAGITGTVILSTELYKAIQEQNERKRLNATADDEKTKHLQTAIRLDGPEPLTSGEDVVKRKVIVHDELGREVVPTGNSTIESFPRIVELSSSPQRNPTSTDTITTTLQDPWTEYTLIGLGLRTVTILGLQVYMVGMYIAVSDVALLQAHLVKRVNPIATTLVPSERDLLRKTLLDPTMGEQEWDMLLREAGCRTLFRIVPVRDTTLAHMRDALVTAATSRATQRSIIDEAFGKSIKEFRQFFGKGTASKGKELLLCRDDKGGMLVLYGDGRRGGRQELGRVSDERFSRMIWLNYLGGKKVASEQARGNIVEGIMEFVERPVGTVATQVV